MNAKIVSLFLLAFIVSGCQPNVGDATLLQEFKIPENPESYNYCNLIESDPNLFPRLEREFENFDKLNKNKNDRLKIFRTGMKVAKQNPPEQCEERFDLATKYFTEFIDAEKQRLELEWDVALTNDLSEDTNIARVQRDIFKLAVNDQVARNTWQHFQSYQGDASVKIWGESLAVSKIAKMDDTSSTYMAELLPSVNWITKEKYGEYISYFAWLLIQHADHRPDLQQLALNRIKPLLESGEVKKSDYAFLTDRVLSNKGLEQVYGTQSTGKCVEGMAELRKIKNPAELDSRRTKMQLPPIEVYREKMTKIICSE